MSRRGTRVYRLDIHYPEGSREPGWRPALWSNPDYLASLSKSRRRELRNEKFRWPRERMFLSSSSAYQRANWLTWHGADVEVYASHPVTWPNHDDETGAADWERCSTASRWFPQLDDLAAIADAETARQVLTTPGITVEDIDQVLAEFKAAQPADPDQRDGLAVPPAVSCDYLALLRPSFTETYEPDTGMTWREYSSEALGGSDRVQD